MSNKFSVAEALKTGLCQSVLSKDVVRGILLTAGYWFLGVQLFGILFGTIVGFANGVTLGFFDERVLPTGSHGHTLLRVSALMLTSVVLLAPAAIASHRNFLLGEKWKLSLSVYGAKSGRKYLGFAVWLMIVVSGPVALLNGAEYWVAEDVISDHKSIYTAGLFLTAAWAFIGIRFFLVLPGSAIEQEIELEDSWRMTDGVAFRAFLSVLLMNLPFVFVNNLIVGLKLETVAEFLMFDGLLGLSGAIQVVVNAYLLSFIYREVSGRSFSMPG